MGETLDFRYKQLGRRVITSGKVPRPALFGLWHGLRGRVSAHCWKWFLFYDVYLPEKTLFTHRPAPYKELRAYLNAYETMGALGFHGVLR